jgi:hypothetical protein
MSGLKHLIHVLDGTTEGAIKGWETRRHGGGEQEGGSGRVWKSNTEEASAVDNRYLDSLVREGHTIEDVKRITPAQKETILDVVAELNAEFPNDPKFDKPGSKFIEPVFRDFKIGNKIQFLSIGGNGIRKVDGVLGITLESDMFVVADPAHMKMTVNSLRVLNVERRGNAYCVVHGHPMKPGSKTDKPEGTAIKCYSIEEFGEAGARKKANAMHYAIAMSQKSNNDSLKTHDAVGSSIRGSEKPPMTSPSPRGLKAIKGVLEGRRMSLKRGEPANTEENV